MKATSSTHVCVYFSFTSQKPGLGRVSSFGHAKKRFCLCCLSLLASMRYLRQ